MNSLPTGNQRAGTTNAPPDAAPAPWRTDRLRRLAALPAPLLLLAIVLLYAADLRTTYEAPHLQVALNFLTRTVATLVIVVLAGRSFLVRGAPGLLLLGCGVALWGSTGFATTAFVTRDANLGVTISNLGIWLAALCFLAGVVTSLRTTRRLCPTGPWLVSGYALALGVAGFVTYAAWAGWLPVFFVEGQGGTMVRHVVLGSAIALLGLTAVLLWEGHRVSPSPFAYWYMLALLLMAAGLCGLVVEVSRNTPLDWTCRAAQYLSAVYMLVAVVGAWRESRPREIALRPAQGVPRYRYGIAMAIVLAAAALQLAFLPVLGTRAAFVTFYPAVILAAFYGGLRAGLMATFLSALMVEFFWLGPAGFAAAGSADWLATTVFVVGCAMISAIIEALHRARSRAAEVQAEARVAAERQSAAEVLHESEARFAQMAHQSPVGIFETNAEGDCIFVNEYWQAIAGLSAAQAAGKGWKEAIHPEDRDRVAAEWYAAAKAGSEFGSEYRFRSRNGKVAWVIGNAKPVRDSSGETTGYLGTILNITERKRAEEELRRTNERLRLLLNALPVGVTMAEDPECGIITANPAAARLFETAGAKNISASAPGRPPHRYFHHGKELRPDEMPMQAAVLGNREIPAMEIEAHLPSGHRWTGLVNATPLHDGEGKVIGGIAVIHDITERKRAEKALGHSEERYRTLFNTLIEGFCIIEVLFDAQGRPFDYVFLEVNPAFEHQTGLPNAQGRRMRELKPEHEAHWFEFYGRVALTGEPARFVSEASALGRWYDVSAYRVGGKDSRKVAILFNDITERKRAEEQISRSQKTFSELVERAPFGIYVIDSEFRIAQMNAGSQAGAFRNVRPVIGRDFAEAMRILWPEPVAAEIIGEFRHTLETGEPYYSPRFTNPRRDLAIVESYEWELHRMSLPDGQHGVVCYYFDSTKLRVAEETVRRLHQQLQYHIQNTPLAVLEFDADLRIAAWSDGAQRVFGWEASEVIGRLMWEMPWIIQEDRAKIESVSEGLMSGRTLRSVSPNRNVRKDGKVIWCEWYNSSLTDSSGKMRSIQSVVLDVTERKEAEQVLSRSRAELERLVAERTATLQELVGELEHFSYTITHDMRAPLRAMRGFGELLNDLCAPCELRERRDFLRKIITAADRMDGLITGALSYSQAVRQELPVENVDTGALLRGMLDSYPELQVSRAQIEVVGELPVVLGNQAGLTQCFSNLLGNAVKFVRPGQRPEVRVRAEERDGRARIWVEDKGIGISKEMLPRVFDMFSRGSKVYEGTGIGLALVRKVAHRMGGQAGVESEEGQGSRFWLELKVAEREANMTGKT